MIEEKWFATYCKYDNNTWVTHRITSYFKSDYDERDITLNPPCPCFINLHQHYELIVPKGLLIVWDDRELLSQVCQQRDRCSNCGKNWWWDYCDGMFLGGKWPCGCPSEGNATLVLERIPFGILRIDEEREL